MRSFQYDIGSGKQYVAAAQPEQATERTTPVTGTAGNCTSGSLAALHAIIQGGGKTAVSALQYMNAVDSRNGTLGNRDVMQLVGECLQRDRQQHTHVPHAAPLQMMPAKRQKMTQEELRQKKPAQAARLGGGQQSSRSEGGRKTPPGKTEDLLHALGTEASLNPSGPGRSAAEIAAASPDKVATLRDLAAAASASDITDVDTAFAAVQTAIDRLMGELDLGLIDAITSPSHATATTKKATQPKKGAAPETAGRLEMDPAGISRLRALAADPDLREILETAELLGYGVGKLDGQLCLVIGGMTYAIEGQINLLHQLFFDDSKHIIFGWCAGNERHNIADALARTLAAHKPLLGKRMSVHSAAYTAGWNPEIIQRHFGDSADPGKVAKCLAKRVADTVSYISQACSTGVGVDMMVKETMPGKEAHVRGFAEDITGIMEDFRASPEIRELLRQRVPLMEDFARNIRHPAHRKGVLDGQLGEFHRAGRRMYGEGTDKARRAELVCHSMSVLEGVAAECIRQDPDTMQRLFGSDAGAGAGGQPFYQRLFEAIGDYKSTKCMGAQEYEFDRFSAAHELIYVYPVDAGPFLSGACRPRVDVLIAKPVNATGVPISVVVPGLGELRASSDVP